MVNPADFSTETRYIEYLEARVRELDQKVTTAQAEAGRWQGIASYWKAIAEARRFDDSYSTTTKE